MAKMKPMTIAIFVVLGILVAGMLGVLDIPMLNGGEDGDGDSDVDLSNLVSAQVALYAQDRFVSGTSITASDENATIIEGGLLKQGVSVNGGTYSAEPNKVIKILFGADDQAVVDDYYANVIDYSVKPIETDQKVQGSMCQVDTAPTITVKNSDDQVQTASANAQSLAAEDKETVTVKVKAGSDECYGNPDADGKNAMCFKYNTTAIQKVKASTGNSVTPYSISSQNTSAGYAITCYELDLLSDLETQTIDVTLEATSTEPGVKHNISILVDDIGVDVDADNSEIIWGFEDEDNNALGADPVYDKIYIS